MVKGMIAFLQWNIVQFIGICQCCSPLNKLFYLICMVYSEQCFSRLCLTDLNNSWNTAGLILIHNAQGNRSQSWHQCLTDLDRFFVLPPRCQTNKSLHHSFHQDTGVRTPQLKAPFGMLSILDSITINASKVQLSHLLVMGCFLGT